MEDVKDKAIDEDAVDGVDEDAAEVGDASAAPERGDGSDYVPQYLRDDPNARDWRVEGNDVRDFIGVDPEYMNYATDAGKPSLTDADRLQYTDQYDHLIGNADDDPEYAEGGASVVEVIEIDENSTPEDIEAALANGKAIKVNPSADLSDLGEKTGTGPLTLS